MRRHLVTGLACLFVLAACPLSAAAQSFEGLGTIPGTWDRFVSQALGVSGDGKVVVGSASRLIDIPECCFIIFEQASRWENGVLEGLGEPYFPDHDRSMLRGASYDGSVVVGQVKTTSAGTEVLVYDDGVISTLPDIAGGSAFARANDVNADGTKIVGYGNSMVTTRALTWTWPAGAVTIVGTGLSLSLIRGVSVDGSVMVGVQDGVAEWINGVPSLLGAPPGSFGGLVVYGVSADDGSTAVGQGTFEFADEAVVWTNGVGASIGGLGSVFRARALDTSADGSVVVGWSDDNSGGGRVAFLWNALDGMRSLQDILENDHGLNLTGWTLQEATGVSDDGLTIVGTGISPSFDARGFIATLMPDADEDGIADDDDNCLDVPNPTQHDSNLDGFGNACDPDYTNDGIVGLPDFAVCAATFSLSSGMPGFDPDVDHTEPPDGVVGLPDFAVFSPSMGGTPGPSGLACALPYHDGTVPCTAGP